MVTSHYAPDANLTQPADIASIADATTWGTAGTRSHGKAENAEDSDQLNYYAVTYGQRNYCAVNGARIKCCALSKYRMEHDLVNWFLHGELIFFQFPAQSQCK